jgi:hypothetical protein
MLRDGYTRSHRATWHHPVVGIQNPMRCLLWKWMVDLAYFQDRDGLKRGQFRATLRELAAVVGMSKSAAQRFKSALVDAEMVTVEDGPSQRSASLWTVVNYDRFQAGHETGHEMGRQRDARRSVVDGVSEQLRDTSGTRNGTRNGTPLETKLESKLESKTIMHDTGSEDFALGGQSSTPSNKSKGVAVDDERWAEVLPRDDKGRPVYPQTFETLWGLWREAQNRPDSKTKAADKGQTYRLIRTHLKTGIPYESIEEGTKAYLAKNWNQMGCVQPPRFYRRKGPMFLDNLDGKSADGGTYTLDDFPNLAKLGAFLAIAMRAAEVEGAPGRPVPPDKAWEVFQAQSAEIQAQVRAEAGR